MLSRILDSTRGKPCSCPENKQCSACKSKVIKPRVHLEDPHRLTIPIVISRYKHRSPVTVNRSTEKRWPYSSKKRDDTPARPTALCTWIRKKRALRQLKREREREKQRQRDILRREREIEFIEQLQRQQKYLEEAEPKIVLPPPKKEKPIKVAPPPKIVPLKALPPPPVEKPKKGKSTYAKPKAESRFVSVRKACYRQTIGERFVNYCYRFCCQLYCCLTILLLIGVAIILLI
ncbi:uncharacterized protein LOC114362644 [Ostrinia furnacalis]|uniref:uncharacterized protein LOC114362644 n=1 Tax=Ostrinia furnacalis TaxID=93504 RepID=UPI00103F4747|nr:uncharacterized protein LOC114362644 [Ostrinia furnacalis]